MWHYWETMLAGILAWLVALSPAWAGAEKPRLVLRGVTETAMLGVPVVVELGFNNSTPKELTVPELTDPFLSFIQWHWEAEDGTSYDVRLDDYHFPAVPEPAAPRQLTLKPGESRFWRQTIITPPTFEKDTVQTLTATVRDSVSREVIGVASIKLKWRDTPDRGALRRLGPTLPQAAVAQHSSGGVIQQMRVDKSIEKVKECAARGDPAAKLVLFCAALHGGEEVLPKWLSLEQSPDQVKAVRNHMMLTSLTQLSGKLTARTVDDLLKSIKDDDFFADELRTSLAALKQHQPDSAAVAKPTTKPLPDADNEGIRQVVEAFRAAFAGGQNDRVLSLLSDDFQYRGAVTRDQFSKEVDESRAKQKALTNAGSTFRLEMVLKEAHAEGNEAVATVIVTAFKDGERLGSPNEQLWRLSREQATWRIRSIR